MTKEIVKINPEEFGLTKENTQSIESAFLPKRAEREAIEPVYNELIKKKYYS